MPNPANNPFTPEQPITEEERFFGRVDVIEWVDDRFVEGQRLLVIYGRPRMGKTSLLFRLQPRLAGKAFTVYVDVAAYPQAPMRELLWHLVEQVHHELYQDRDDPPALSRDAYSAQPDYLAAVVMPLWRQALRGKQLVLLLDGLKQVWLKEGSWAELFLHLREIVGRESGLHIVAAISGFSAAGEPLPALRGLPQWDLDALSEDQAEELLVGTARYQLGFDYDAVRQIYAWTGGHPYLVQAFGAELYRSLAPYGQVTIHSVGDAVPVVAAMADGLFAEEWNGLSRQAQITLAAVAAMVGYRGAITPWDIALFVRRAGHDMAPEAVQQALPSLCDAHIMRWYGGSAYALGLELWRPWLTKVHPLPEVLFGKRARSSPDVAAPGRRFSIDWGVVLLWVGIGLGVLLVSRIWQARGSRGTGLTPIPTPVVLATPRPTATRVVLPGRIAYMAQNDAREPWSIWLMRDDGTDPMRLTDSASDDTMPAWSPDGKRLAFISNRSGNRDVWVLNADGSKAENLTQTPADEWTPAWSPDGTEIAFASNRDGNWEIYIAKANGSQPKRFTKHPAADYAPAWSPDGKRLAFVSERDGNAEIYVINRDGSQLTRLTENEVTDFAPAWSPDGKRIAFETYRDGNMEIYTMAADGSDARNLSNSPQSDEHWPSWSPDGKRIAYYSNRSGNWDIFVMQADGSQQTNLTMSAAIEQGPAWQPLSP